MSDAADTEELEEGTLLSHLIELRSRLIKMFAAVIGVFIVLLPFSGRIFEVVAKPLVAVLPGHKMIATSVTAPLLTPFKLTFFVAILIAIPVILYQLWAFVAPGLYRKEKRFAFPLLFSSIFLFYAGAAFAYFAVFPLVFGFFVKITPTDVEMTTDISQYLDFVTPIATVLTVWTGLTTPEKLGKARPYVFLLAFVIGMLLTPPDVISQTLLAVPVYLLYEVGIFMSRVFARRRSGAEDEAVAADG
jgi:sec-independent protein translocase protein TatC